MKKLLTILVICVLAASLYAVDNPFTFSLSNLIRAKFGDTSAMSKLSSGVYPNLIADSPANDFNYHHAAIYDEIGASASMTIAEIYTLSFSITEKISVGMEAAAVVTTQELVANWGNSIKVIPDYLTIGIDVAYVIFGGTKTSSALDPKLSLSGSIPDTGISWSFYDRPRLSFNLSSYKDNNPTHAGKAKKDDTDGDGDVDDDDAITNNYDNYNGLFAGLNNEAKIEFNWNFGTYFMPENFSMTLKLAQQMNVNVPYSYYLEANKTITLEGNHGLAIGLAGFDVGIYAFILTEDYLNSSAAPKGHANAHQDWDDVTRTYITSPDVNFTNGDEDVIDRPADGVLKVGPKLTLGFSKGMGSFGFMWKGYASNLRDSNVAKANLNLGWTNEFEIDVKIAF